MGPGDASSVTSLKAQLLAAKERAAAARTKEPSRRLRIRGERTGRTERTEHAEHAGHAGRSARRAREPSPDRLEASRSALTRKAAKYRKLAQGLGLEEDSLVDWDAKDADEHTHTSGESDAAHSDADDSDASLVEYTDEFGRVRSVPRSEAPRSVLREEPEASDGIYGPATSFPVFHREVPSLPVVSEAVHFDADTDVRARGAAFYRFAKDERVRQAQQAELKARREETIHARQHTDAPPAARPVSLGRLRRQSRFAFLASYGS